MTYVSAARAGCGGPSRHSIWNTSVYKFTSDVMDRNTGMEPGHRTVQTAKMPRVSSNRMTMTIGLPILGSLMVCHVKNAMSRSTASTSTKRRISV